MPIYNNDLAGLVTWDTRGSYTGKVSCASLGIPVGVIIIEAVIIAKINNNDNVVVSITIPYNDNNVTYTKIRSGYFQNDSNGGYVDFAINNGGDSFKLHNAYLNGTDVGSTTTWTVYYRWKM